MRATSHGKRVKGRGREDDRDGPRCAPRPEVVAAESGADPRGLRDVPPEVRGNLDASGGLPGLARSVPPVPAAREVARIFDAVADPARLRILFALERTALCPCLLRGIEPMANSALSYHLRVLRRAGLVATAAKSSYRIYEATALGRSLLAFARRDPRLGPRLRSPDG